MFRLSEICFFEKKHFKEFKEDKTKLSNKALSNCLKEGEKMVLLKKWSLTPLPTTEYYLTEYGQSMNWLCLHCMMK